MADPGKKQPANVTVLGNAANFLLLHDRDTAEKLLKKAQALDPNNPEWSRRLGELYQLNANQRIGTDRRQAAQQALGDFEQAYRNNINEETRCFLLQEMAKTAFDAGAFEKARAYATDLLDRAGTDQRSGCYGDAIHHGNLVLGRLALRMGDIQKAKSYLLAAGKTPGSGSLDSFGPNMTLAKELLEKGERQTVLLYFQECAVFWKDSLLIKWTEEVKRGQIPNFGANLDY